MAEGVAEAVGPRVDMRIEMDQRERAVPAGGGTQQRQRDGVVATQGEQMRVSRRLALDQTEAAGEVAERDLEIAAIRGDRRGVPPGVRVRAVDQHAARLTDRRWTAARAGTIGGAEIERDPRDRHPRTGTRPESEESGAQRKGRGAAHASLPT